MKIKAGSKAKDIILPSISGGVFDTSTLRGRPYMISFFRFASCPFCNMRVHQLVKRFEEFGEDFTIVAIFDSSLDNLIMHANRHHAQFPILADGKNIYYRAYGIERSLMGMLKGMFLRMPTLISGLLKGYLPLAIKGSILTMPADFLVDRQGVIRAAYYGKDEGDHMDMEEVMEFSNS